LLLDGRAEYPRHLEPVAEAADTQNLLSLADGNRNRNPFQLPWKKHCGKAQHGLFFCVIILIFV
jgi:hypothetical protein